MGKNTVSRIQALGQSVWIDYIRRSMLTTGELGALVRQGITGLTSNPTIFEKAISGSTDYDEALLELSRAGRPPAQVFEALTVKDIQDAADILRTVYDRTDGADGYTSIELPPPLAHDRRATVSEGRRLFADVGRPNVLIKVPATPEGVNAFRTLIGEGINVNVTLIFSLESYRGVMEAYLRGLEQRAAGGGDLRVASVASFFVSRVDAAVDPLLRARADDGDASALALLGTAAVANARAAYGLFKTARGRLIRILVTLNTRRPGAHNYRLFGTEGSVEWYSHEGFCRRLDRERDEKEGWERIDIGTARTDVEVGSGHGGTDIWTAITFSRALLAGKRVPIDVYRMADYTLPGILANRSALQGG
ncbi:MAG: hypothetical protein IIA54_04180, partial [Chloroflexi bacterium]|nr:hypothetical protein [Chloroflexota bacterium]